MFDYLVMPRNPGDFTPFVADINRIAEFVNSRVHEGAMIDINIYRLLPGKEPQYVTVRRTVLRGCVIYFDIVERYGTCIESVSFNPPVALPHR